MDISHALIAVVLMTLVTFSLRALPFVAGSFLKRYQWVASLGNFLPPAIMALLLMHSVNELSIQSNTAYWPEGISVALTLVVHFFWRKPLVSILSGTGLYVLLLHIFFS